MTIWRIDTGVTGTLGTDGLMQGVDNDHGNIRHGGSIGDATAWDSSSLGEQNRVITVVSGVAGADGAIAGAATFAGGDQVIRRVTTDLAGVSNTEMRSGGSDSANRQRDIKSIEVVQIVFTKRGIRENRFNRVTGEWDSGFPEQASSGTHDIANGVDAAAGDDVAANPSRATPGLLTYRTGRPLPSGDQYKPKTG